MQAPALAAPPLPPPQSARAALFWGLAPLLVFYGVERAWGTAAALIASIAFTVLDLTVTWIRHRRIDRTALFMGGLVVTLGGLSLASDDERFMLYTPVASDALFAGVLLWGWARKQPLLVTMTLRQSPEVAQDPARLAFLAGMTLRFALNLLLHGAITLWVVSSGQSRETWLFVTGPLQYLFLGAQFGLEVLWGRMTLPPDGPEESDGP